MKTVKDIVEFGKFLIGETKSVNPLAYAVNEKFINERTDLTFLKDLSISDKSFAILSSFKLSNNEKFKSLLLSEYEKIFNDIDIKLKFKFDNLLYDIYEKMDNYRKIGNVKFKEIYLELYEQLFVRHHIPTILKNESDDYYKNWVSLGASKVNFQMYLAKLIDRDKFMTDRDILYENINEVQRKNKKPL